MIRSVDISSLRNADQLDQLVQRCSCGDHVEFVEQLSGELNRLLGSDLKQAGRLIKALKVALHLFPNGVHGRLLAMEARYHHRTGDPGQAGKLYKKAIEHSRRCGNWRLVAQTRLGLMDVHMYTGEYRKATRIGRQALLHFRRQKMSIPAARVMTNLGNVYHRMDNNRVALDYYDKAAAIFAEKGGIPLAIVNYNRANIFCNLGHLSRAAELYRQTAQIYRESEMDLYYSRARYSLGYLSFLADKHSDALTTLESVLDQFHELGDKRAVAVTRLDLAEINLHLNQYGTAISLGEEVIGELRSLGMKYELGKAHLFVAQAFSRCGDLGPARRHLSNAEHLFAGEDNLLWRGIAQQERSLLTRQAGKLVLSLKQAREARRLFGRSGDERRSVDADITILEIMAESGRQLEVVRQVRRLIRQDLLLGQEYRLYSLLGECHRAQNDVARALTCYQVAATKVEKMLDGLFPDEMRFFFAIDKLAPYLGAAECLLELGDVTKSFEQYLRGLAVINYRYSPQRISAERIPGELMEKREKLRSSLRDMERMPHGDSRAVPGISAARRAEQQLWQVERKIRSLGHRPDQPEATIIPRQMINDLKQRNETLVGFATFDETIVAFLNCGDRVYHYQLDTTLSELRQVIRELHFVMERPVLDQSRLANKCPVVDHYLKHLYSLLMAPVESRISTNRLIVLADGLFSQIPWCALRDAAGTYLKDKFDIRLISNPIDLSRCQRDLKLNRKSFGSIFAVTSEYLPSVAEEGGRIGELFGRAKQFISPEASVVHLKDRLKKKAAFLHVAAHASRSSENPLFSRLLMSDGPFFPFDLFESGVGAQLVSLSGCQTAAPGLYYGNSYSLAKAFHQAGARFVLASLWSVSDKLSMEMMVEFYRHLGDGENIFQAYHKAVKKIEEITPNPAFWSAFALMGI